MWFVVIIAMIEQLKKSQIAKTISVRMMEFKTPKFDEKIFSELCFCLLTANFNAERSIRIQEQIGEKGFLNLSEEKLAHRLKELGHRFPNTRAKYIVGARKHLNQIIKLVGQVPDLEKTNKTLIIKSTKTRESTFVSNKSISMAEEISGKKFASSNTKKIRASVDNLLEVRSWLVKNITGLGLKESSHFLRNIGFEDVAIVDFHIVDLLVREGLIRKIKPGALTKKKYLEIEQLLFDISRKVNLNLAELDLYLWYLETGKVLK